MHTLLIIRHAKSDWPHGVPDHDRPLGARGFVDAPEIGRWLAASGLVPQFAAVSSARRTTQTWQLLASQWDRAVEWLGEERIYAAPWQSLLEVVRGLPEEAGTAALVGHNPGCEDLASALAGEDSDESAAERMTAKYPTAGVAVVEIPGVWEQVRAGSGRLVDFVVPRGGAA